MFVKKSPSSVTGFLIQVTDPAIYSGRSRKDNVCCEAEASEIIVSAGRYPFRIATTRTLSNGRLSPMGLLDKVRPVIVMPNGAFNAKLPSPSVVVSAEVPRKVSADEIFFSNVSRPKKALALIV